MISLPGELPVGIGGPSAASSGGLTSGDEGVSKNGPRGVVASSRSPPRGSGERGSATAFESYGPRPEEPTPALRCRVRREAGEGEVGFISAPTRRFSTRVLPVFERITRSGRVLKAPARRRGAHIRYRSLVAVHRRAEERQELGSSVEAGEIVAELDMPSDRRRRERRRRSTDSGGGPEQSGRSLEIFARR